MAERYLCPVCGYPDLAEPPWDNDSPSDDICPSCGTQFGYHDAIRGGAGKRQELHRRLREAWRSAGCPWSSYGRPPPAEWNPQEQLQAVES